MWAYLDSLGVLEKGTDEEIKRAKKEYRKIYLLGYKRNQRKTKPEFSVLFSKKGDEFKNVSDAAWEHNTSVTNYIKLAVLAYTAKTFLVPDKEQVGRLEQLLSQCRNEIRGVCKNRLIENKYSLIEKRIDCMENTIAELLRHPPSLEEAVTQAIEKSPEIKSRFFEIISANDHQN